MSKDQKELGTIVVLEEGVELLGVVRDRKARVAIYRDTREGLYHWYELEFLEDSGEWKPVLRLGDQSIQEAIDLFAKAKAKASGTSSKGHDE